MNKRERRRGAVGRRVRKTNKAVCFMTMTVFVRTVPGYREGGGGNELLSEITKKCLLFSVFLDVLFLIAPFI